MAANEQVKGIWYKLRLYREKDKYSEDDHLLYLTAADLNLDALEQNRIIAGRKRREKKDRWLAFYAGLILGVGLKVIDIIYDLAISI